MVVMWSGEGSEGVDLVLVVVVYPDRRLEVVRRAIRVRVLLPPAVAVAVGEVRSWRVGFRREGSISI